MIATDTIESNLQPVPGADIGLVEAIIGASRECVLLIDRRTRVVAANVAARTTFGREAADVLQSRLTELIRDPELHVAILKALENGVASELQVEIIGADTRNYDVYVSAAKIGGQLHAIAAFYDITRLEKLERVRQEFLSNISHELRTPLTSILAFVETLEDGAIDDTQNNRKFLGVIRRNAERMNALISDILELSLIESGRVMIEKRYIHVSSIVEDIFASLSSKARDRSVTLENLIPPEGTVFADSARIEQMLTNLIDNGIKFNRAGGSVTVALKPMDESSILTVSDTGEGILPDHQTRIFERFYRADRSRAREVGGTGLGLSIVKHLARLHGGEVRVSSRLTEGCVFSIELPNR
ncbi:MAG TPA: ATP-binding protein [Pyrinomonadaceae bacterium]|nr:ATP-binding protein [Pyrinomonadaceae bacterium]